MKLYFPFPQEVRKLFLYCWECWLCGENGSRTGGLEIHHILGRSKYGYKLDSAFNASVLCKKCHNTMGHSVKEQKELFGKTINFLVREQYKPTKYDYNFITENASQLDLSN
jgi:hypothetical protein